MISQLVLALTLVASLLSCAAATTIVKRDVLTDAEDAVLILNAILFNTFYTVRAFCILLIKDENDSGYKSCAFELYVTDYSVFKSSSSQICRKTR